LGFVGLWEFFGYWCVFRAKIDQRTSGCFCVFCI
jgi:hypothetical protein